MKAFIPNIISPKEAKTLRDGPIYLSSKCLMPEKKSVIVERLKKHISSTLNKELNWEPPSIIRIEKNKNQDWHTDAGSYNWDSKTMLWYDFGCSILLLDDENAGYLEYRDGTKLLPKEHFCGLAIHSSDVEHRTVSNGTRVVFLAFIQRSIS
jgi:hypothetical protein